ncbi:hypothetical protein LTR37_020292 [Vermiconidia calcicola]|uniref:Uncharacterized protein n=1 Tax=Vermiconidia calcicola TaxID=1690605 RepID=A0ACC3MBM5_9PEZI|nr:hypothetical protein LTR37_020292 [Vermiconidia calcicola]
MATLNDFVLSNCPNELQKTIMCETMGSQERLFYNFTTLFCLTLIIPVSTYVCLYACEKLTQRPRTREQREGAVKLVAVLFQFLLFVPWMVEDFTLALRNPLHVCPFDYQDFASECAAYVINIQILVVFSTLLFSRFCRPSRFQVTALVVAMIWILASHHPNQLGGNLVGDLQELITTFRTFFNKAHAGASEGKMTDWQRDPGVIPKDRWPGHNFFFGELLWRSALRSLEAFAAQIGRNANQLEAFS